jgi:hypothetical protein
VNVIRTTIRAASAVIAIGLTASMLTGCASAPQTPESIVKSYLEAVASGDAAKAIEIINPGIEKGDRILLTDKALKASTKIENIVVLPAVTDEGDLPVDTSKSDVNPGTVEIQVTYDIDGETVNNSFKADQSDKGWKVTGGYKSLEVFLDEVATGFTVNGVKVEGSELRTLPVFPGTYEVAMAENDYLDMKPYTVATGNTTGDVPKFTVKEEIQSEFTAFIDEYSAACFAAPAASRDENCSNWHEADEDDKPTNVAWTVVTAPVFESRYEDGTIYFSDTGVGEKNLTYNFTTEAWLGGQEARVYDVTDELAYSVKTELVDGKAKFSVIGNGEERVASKYKVLL